MLRPSIVLFAMALAGLVACSTGSGGTGVADGGAPSMSAAVTAEVMPVVAA